MPIEGAEFIHCGLPRELVIKSEFIALFLTLFCPVLADVVCIGEYIRREVIPAKMSVTAAAKALGIGRPALSNMLNGNAALSPELASKMEQAFGVKAADLLEMQAKQDAAAATANTTALVPVKSYVPPFLQIKAHQIEGWADRITPALMEWQRATMKAWSMVPSWFVPMRESLPIFLMGMVRQLMVLV